jgi:hypothetical protein
VIHNLLFGTAASLPFGAMGALGGLLAAVSLFFLFSFGVVSNADLGFPSLLDLLKQLGPDARLQTDVVETLSKFNPLLQDSVWQEGNMPTGEMVGQRVGLPNIGPRQLNTGIAASRSKYNQFTETIAIVDGLSIVDVVLAERSGDPTAYRAKEDKGFVMQFMNTIENYAFNASLATNGLLFNGFASRFASSTAVGTGAQVVKIDPGASGAHESSIWLIGWSPQTAYMIYPRGSKGGIEANAYPRYLLSPQNNGQYMEAFPTYWRWHIGLVVRDPRFVSRMANFDSVNASATADLIIPGMIFGYHKIYNPNQARFAWYCNRFTGAYLHQQARNKTQYQLRVEEPGGQPIVSMMGIPVRISDALTQTEATIS